jgi:hypothetical protein
MFYLEDIKAMQSFAKYLYINSLSESDVDYEPRGSQGWSRHRDGEESRNYEDQYYRYITVKVEGHAPDLEYDFQETTISHLRELMSHFATLLDNALAAS